MSTTDLTRPHEPVAVRRRGPLLPITAVAFTTVADATALNVTLPDIRVDLGLTTTTASWVVNAYLVALGGLLLLGGRLADVAPRRTVLLGGLGVYLAGATAAVLAPSGAVLLAARGVQGAGAAIALSCALALLTSTYPSGPGRARALGLWGVASGAGGTVGILVGGSMVAGPGWRAAFLIGALGALVALLGALVRVPAAPGRGGRIDVIGALAVTVGVGALTLALSSAVEQGPTSATTLVATTAAAIGLVVFVRRCRNHDAPLVAPALVAIPALVRANVVIAGVGAAGVGTFVVLPAYQFEVLGWSGALVGLAGVPMALAIVVASMVAPRLAARRGTRPVLLGGLVLLAAGLALLAPTPGPAGAGWALLTAVAPTLLVGLGVGTGFVLATDLGTGSAPRRLDGAASGLLSASREVGGALGVTVTTAAATVLAVPGAGLGAGVGGVGSGYGVVLLAAATVALGAAVLVALAPRDAA